MDTVKIFVIVLIAVFAITILKQEKSSLILPATALFCIVIFKHILTRFNTQTDIFNSSVFSGDLTEYTQPILKVFGISLLTETTADICRQAGENAFASKVEMFGKAEMIIICFPLVEKILDIVKNLITF